MNFSIVALVVVVCLILFTIRGRFVRSPEVGNLPGPGTFEFDIVGESHYQGALEKICGGRTDQSAEKIVQARLVMDNTNVHDKLAVRVEINGALVGYMPRKNAREYRKQLAANGHANMIGVCAAMVVGGWDRGPSDKGLFGVKLDLPVN